MSHSFWSLECWYVLSYYAARRILSTHWYHATHYALCIMTLQKFLLSQCRGGDQNSKGSKNWNSSFRFMGWNLARHFHDPKVWLVVGLPHWLHFIIASSNTGHTFTHFESQCIAMQHDSPFSREAAKEAHWNLPDRLTQHPPENDDGMINRSGRQLLYSQ